MDRAKRDALICLANIERSREIGASLEARERAHIRELAYSMTALIPKELGYEEGEEFRRIYLELCQGLEPDKRIALCRDLGEITGNLIRRISEVKDSKSAVSIVYMKNALADIAYRSFSECFGQSKVYYADDFESALEDVYYSKADYAILPISSSRNGLMFHFLELLLRYEMKIVISCEVHSIADDSDNRFVLLSKNNELLFSDREDRIGFDFLLSQACEYMPYVMQAAHSYGATLSFVQSLPDEDACILRYELTAGALSQLCIYLFLEAPRHIPFGIYKILE